MVPAFDYVQVPFQPERQIIRILQFAGTSSLCADDFDKFPGPLEDLDAVVARVGDVKQPVRPQCQCPNSAEFALTGAGLAEPSDKFTVGIEFRDPLVDSKLTDVVEAIRVLDRVAD